MGKDLPCYSNKFNQLVKENVHVIINLPTKCIKLQQSYKHF